MKTLKFRIYDKTEKRMKFLGSIWNMPDPSYDFDEIQQFTGLLDRNGKEIYEGDIVTSTKGEYEVNGKVIFNTGKFFVVDENDSWLENINLNTEVIGNIFEHLS